MLLGMGLVAAGGLVLYYAVTGKDPRTLFTMGSVKPKGTPATKPPSGKPLI